MVTLCTGSALSSSMPTSVCPPSWYAVRRFSLSLITLLRRSGPIITRSAASSISGMLICFLLRRAAINAASFTRLLKSAPVKPGVRLAITSSSTSLPTGLPFTCTFKISRRPLISGRSTTIWRSKRPGRKRAGSRISGRLVAAIIIMPSLAPKPSISTSSWLSVCSRSSCPPPSPAPR